MAKKKTAKKKIARKAKRTMAVTAQSNGSLIDPRAIQKAAEVLMAAVDDYRTELSELPGDGTITQTHIEVARFAAFAKGAMGDMEKLFEANALRLRKRGVFEEGNLRVDFETKKGSKSPKWKDEAIAQARKVAGLEGDDFNADQYADGVLVNTTPKADSTKPKIRETS